MRGVKGALHAVSILSGTRESFKVKLRVQVVSGMRLRVPSSGSRTGARLRRAIIGAPWNASSSSPETKPSPTAPCAPGLVSPAAIPARRPPRSSRPPRGSRASTPSGASTRRWRSRPRSGRRSPACARMVTMKHVGLNVAADPFMTLSLTGINAGLVVVCADDPGMHSSQNEQDNRNYAKFAKVPMLEPSDSQEAYDFVAEAFALSEEFDTPVLLRTTTRISHGRGQVLPRVPVAGRAARVRAGHQQVRDGPAVRAAAEPARPRAPREAPPARRGDARSTCSRRAPSTSASSPRAWPTLRPRGVPQGVVPQAGHVPPAARTPRWRASTSTSRASPWSRSSTRSSRSRCGPSACR